MTNTAFSLAGKRVWVAGHNGMVGSALVRRLQSEDCNTLTVDRRTLDLRRQKQVEDWLSETRPDAIFMAAAKVGGIFANDSHPAQFISDNLSIQTNIIEAARKLDVSKVLFMGSVCIYPKMAPQPILEEDLLSGSLEPTNQWYAVAKIAGLKMIQAYRREYGCDFISAMPANLYGAGDNFDLAGSHVLPALIRKTHEAKCAGASEIAIWGSGTPRREFLHVDDCADALIYLMQKYSGENHVNVGSGKDIAIIDLAHLVAEILDFQGAIHTDISKPDGTPSRLMSNEKLTALGWRPRVALKDGIAATYRWFLDNIETLRGA